MQPDSQEVDRIIRSALAEDIGQGDATAALLFSPQQQATLYFVSRETLVTCGADVVARVFAAVDASIKTTILQKDGTFVAEKTQLIKVEGAARSILSAERVALNLFQRMSSVSTTTARYVERVKHTKAVLLDTRKTMPGLRVLDKYAVTVGGATNHRMRLDDGIMIKDNHISVCGGVRAAFEKARAGNQGKLPIVVECDTKQQVLEALDAGADRIMLDNMSPTLMKEIVIEVAGRAKLEASGNVNLETIQAIAETGVDYISVGRLTHSVTNVDIGLDAIYG